MLIPIACHQKIWQGWGRIEIKWMMLSGIFLSLHFAFWITSLKYTSVASSVVLVTTNPIFVGIFSRIFFREKHSYELLLGKLHAAGWLGAAGVILSLLGYFIPSLGRWVYLLWMALTYALGRIVSPVVTAIIFLHHRDAPWGWSSG
jgi:drug/metabolite transporter (DMT)-like permease